MKVAFSVPITINRSTVIPSLGATFAVHQVVFDMYNSALTVQGVAVNKSIVASIVRGDAEGLRSIALRLRGDAEGLWAIGLIWHQFDSISCRIW